LIPYKGPTLAALAYNDIALRQFGDLDILVKREDFYDVQNVFLALDYSIGVTLDWEYTLINHDNGVALDIHREITPKNFSFSLDFNLLQRRLRPVAIGSERVNTLRAEDTLIILCIQLVKDAWETHALRLSKLCDISELLAAQPDIDWRLVSETAKALGCSRIVSFGTFAAHRLLGAPETAIAVNHKIGDHDLSFLINHLLSQLFDVGSTESLAGEASHKFHYKLRERWQDKVFPLCYPLLSKVTPNEKDREFVALPSTLEALYFIVRPVRLTKKFGRRFARVFNRK